MVLSREEVAIFRLLRGYHKEEEEADVVCAAQGTEPGPTGGYSVK